MKRVATALAIGFGCAAIVAAQTSTDQTSAPQTPPKAGMQGSSITVSGCLMRGDEGATTGTSGSTAGAPASRTGSGTGNSASFILTNASPSTGAASSAGSPPSTAGTTGTSSTKGAGSTYVLEGSSSDLSASNVGKRVEVTGTVDHSASSSTGAAGSPAGAPGSTRSADAEHLKVSSIKVIGSDCGSK